MLLIIATQGEKKKSNIYLLFLVLLTAFDVYKALADAIHDQDN